MQTLWQDLRYGARMLIKKPGYTMIAVLTLALGIGATTAIFSVVNSVLLKPLPYPDAERLIYIGQQYRSGLAGSGEPKFMYWREHSRSFEAMACYSAYGGAGGNLSGGDEAEYVRGIRVSQDFFRALGIYPVVGRAFTAEEDIPGGVPVAILSHGLWQKSFAGDEGLIGRTVTLNDQQVTVVGIMPPGFRFRNDVDLFVPMQARPGANVDPNAEVIGRLKPGISLPQAEAELKLIAEKYRQAFPRQMQDGESIGVQPYRDIFTEGVSNYLWIFLGAVSFLLLIACANVANLQLARAASRQREIAVRIALGAGRGRIMRQLLTEGLVLAFAGGCAGMLVAVWGTQLLIGLIPARTLPDVMVIAVDWRVLAFAIGTAMVTGLLFGMAPAWQARKVDVNSALKEAAGKSGAIRGRLRGSLVVAEVALSIVLLVGAGLLIRTFANLMGVTPGFNPHNTLTFQIELNGDRYDTTGEAADFYQRALERIGGLPGVEAAAITNKLPLDWQFNMPVTFPEDVDRLQSVQFRMISPEYFRVMKIPVTRGRSFTDADNSAGSPVAIVNEAFARQLFDGQNPFSRQLSIGRSLDDPARQVVGVVGDIKQSGLDSLAPPMVFVPISQMPDKLMAIVRAFTTANFTVRSTVDPQSLIAAVKGEIAGLDPTLPLANIHTMEEIVALSVSTQRFNMMLLSLFAILGILLAAVGIYGVMSYSVAQRTNEIGLRIALGAQTRDVIRLVLRQGLSLTLAGAALGLAGAWGVTRLMKSLLFGVETTDPLTYVSVVALLAAVSLAACYIPARRAMKVDPMSALRYE